MVNRHWCYLSGSILGITCSLGSLKPSTWMLWMQSIKRGPPPTEQWGQLFWSWRAALPRRRTIYLQFFLSPLSFCSNMALVMHTYQRPIERWSVRQKQPWTWEADALWSGEASKLYGNPTFHIPKLETPKISMSVRLEHAFSELSRVPLFEGWGESFFLCTASPSSKTL